MEMAREVAAGKQAAGSGGGGKLAGGEYWSEALKSFLDHIPVSSVPGALQPSASPGTPIDAPTNLVPYFAPIDARRLDGSVRDAVDAMYGSNAAGAVIVDDVRSSFGKFVDRDIGVVELSSLLLWALEVGDHRNF
jgi:hypothetical protein